MIEHRRELILFLLEAKKNSYAAGLHEVEPVVPGSREHGFHEGDFRYSDTYFGGTCFSGTELVRYKDAPYWAMNYYGRAVVAGLPEEFFSFLKECLLRVPEFAPYRGPRYHRAGQFDYSCSWTGDLESFQGKESISKSGSCLYELFFHGGVIVQ